MTNEQERQIERAFSILSDAQELITLGSTDRAHYMINLAKMQLDEALEA
jgi:hypothetical protein